MSIAAALLLAATAVLVGALLLAARSERAGLPWAPGYRRVLEAFAGLLVLHLGLSVLQAVGLPWNRPALLASSGMLIAGLATLVRLRRSPPGGRRPAGSGAPVWGGWGDGVAVVAAGAFSVSALALRAISPDYIYHWGVKAKKFALLGGVDFHYLSRPWNHYTHPDYPNLLPELYAATATLGGVFGDRGMMVWSALFFALLLLAVREVAHRELPPGILRQGALAAIALGTAGFSIGYLQAGAADLMIAAALAAALPPLLRPGKAGSPLALGLAAAFAAAAKIEGLPLAVLMIVLFLARRWATGNPEHAEAWPRAVAESAAPAILTATPWLIAAARHGLFQSTNTGIFDGERARLIFEAAGVAFATPQWHFLSYSVLALPLLLFSRRARPAALLAALQLAFYFFVYFTSPVDADFYVRSSLPRLLFHLVPAAMLGIFIAVSEIGRAQNTAKPP